MKMDSPYKIKDTARNIVTDQAWKKIELEILEHILKEKADQSEQFSQTLIETGDRPIIHTVQNSYWGIGCKSAEFKEDGNYNGYNCFGKMLESLRSSLIASKSKESKSNFERQNHQETVTKTKNKRNILVLGNSLICNNTIRPEGLAPGHKVTSEYKATAHDIMTQRAATEVSPDIVVLQTVTNESVHESKDTCLNMFIDCMKKLKQYYQDAKIVVSLAPYRDDKHFETVKYVNKQISEIYKDDNMVVINYNHPLQDGVNIGADGIHLTNRGYSILSNLIRKSVESLI